MALDNLYNKPLADFSTAPDLAANASKGINTGIQLATMQSKIEGQKTEVEKQKDDLERAKFDRTVNSFKTLTRANPQTAKRLVKPMYESLMKAGIPVDLNVLEEFASDDTHKRNFMQLDNAGFFSEIGNSPQARLEALNALGDLSNDPFTAMASHNQKLLDNKQDMAKIAAQERAMDKRLSAATETRATAAEDKVRSEYSKEKVTADTKAMKNIYSQINTFVADNNSVGDLGIITKYMKMLDPDSSVRETEFANASQAQGALRQAQNLVKKWKDGDRLDPAMRKLFLETAAGLLQAQQKQQAILDKQYADLSARKGINAANVVMTPLDGTGPVSTEGADPRFLKAIQHYGSKADQPKHEAALGRKLTPAELNMLK